MLAVVMAGGSGTRFWPVSRNRRPKQFLNITGKSPMILETCDRLKPLVQNREIIIVLGRGHVEEAKRLLHSHDVHLLAEPVGRNTAPCITLGALYAQHLGYDGPIAFLPADHFIRDRDSFLSALRAAGRIAGAGGLVTLGIPPTRPETGYGYIRREPREESVEGIQAFRVSAFVEKPDFKTAQSYVAGGEYYWNSGIFVATAETILGEIKSYLPDMYDQLAVMGGSFESKKFDSRLEDVYKGLHAVSFDYGVMEKTRGKVYVIPCDCGWSDVGTWQSLYDLRSESRDPYQNLSQGESLLLDCRGNLVRSQGGRLVACLGLRDCLVVDTPDALLVADLRQSQNIRELVEEIKRAGREDLV